MRYGGAENEQHDWRIAVIYKFMCPDRAGRKRNEIPFPYFGVTPWGLEGTGTFHDVAHLFPEIVKMHWETHLTG